MSQKRLILLSVLTGILLTPAWYSWGSGLILLGALVPLLFVENELITNPNRFPKRLNFTLPFLAFFIWNALTVWWIKNASFPGMLFALFFNSFILTLPFWLFNITHKKLGDGFGYLSFIFYWLACEYLYMNAEISFTWLNLGNGFAQNIPLIQWYDITGIHGGSLWILLCNVFIFKIIKKYKNNSPLSSIRSDKGILTVLIFVPIIFSLIRYSTYKEESNPYEIVVIQPNIDPYMKFNDISPDKQMDILINLSDSLVSQNTDYIVVPETFINDNVWLNQLESNPSIIRIRRYLSSLPKTKMIIGATTYKLYRNNEPLTPTARPFRNDSHYDSFNTALQIDSTDNIQFYHKSQLVVGVEKMPYPQYFRFLQKIMLRLGGTFRSHGTQEFRECLISPQDSNKIAPVICYESVFGEYVTEYINKAGANMIFVITNDGWWGDTPGYVQHNSYSCLRAVETRRSIARSANTGISCFIDQKGEIHQKLSWWERSAIKRILNANDKITFYTRNGDYIGKISTFSGILILLFTVVKLINPALKKG